MSGRARIRRLGLTVAFACSSWALFLWLSGGFDTTVLGLRVHAHDALRPLLIASIGLVTLMLLD
jgi:hypothetical protein